MCEKEVYEQKTIIRNMGYYIVNQLVRIIKFLNIKINFLFMAIHYYFVQDKKKCYYTFMEESLLFAFVIGNFI